MRVEKWLTTVCFAAFLILWVANILIGTSDFRNFAIVALVTFLMTLTLLRSADSGKLNDQLPTVNPHSVWQHYKGEKYIVDKVVTHTETEEQLVIYYKLDGSGQVWARPLSMWYQQVGQIPRFTFLEDLTNDR